MTTPFKKQALLARKRIVRARRAFEAEVALLCLEDGTQCALARSYQAAAKYVYDHRTQATLLRELQEHFAEHTRATQPLSPFEFLFNTINTVGHEVPQTSRFNTAPLLVEYEELDG